MGNASTLALLNHDIRPLDFATRRKHYLKQTKGALTILPSASVQLRNNDNTFSFRQDSSFFYLTSFDEPESYCLLSSENKAAFQMFVRPRDKAAELWHGKILGPETAKIKLGADAAFASQPDTHLKDAVIDTLTRVDRIYYRVGVNFDMDKKLFEWMRLALRKLGRTGRALWPIIDPDEVLGEMRLTKSPAEIDRLRLAANISAEGHVQAMRLSRPGMYEYEIEAILYHSFRVRGAQGMSYNAIVAAGSNACVLHYSANNKKMAEQDLLLIDAGAEFDFYAGDITRVFPMNGRFLPAQREVYAAVLKAQKECLRLARPGKTFRDIQLKAEEVLTEELKVVRVLKGNTKQLIDKKAHATFFPHRIGHWLGMDTHDVGKYYQESYTQYRKFEPGMVLTIEPGLYFADPSSPPKYKGIGVRIEDDCLITKDGCEILTAAVPKEIDEVEALCSRS